MSEQWDEKNVGHFFVLDLVSPASKSGFQKLFKSQHFNKNDYAMPMCLIILHGQLSSMTCRFQTRHFLCVLVRNSFSAFSSTNFFLKSVFGKFSSCFFWQLTGFFWLSSAVHPVTVVKPHSHSTVLHSTKESWQSFPGFPTLLRSRLI